MKKSFLKAVLALLLLFCLTWEANAQETTKNKEVVRRYFEELINQQRPEIFREIYAEDYLFHNLENGQEQRGLTGFEAFLPYFFKAFPDIHYTIDQMVAEGDKVVVQVTARGTHMGEFWGYPASNNKIHLSEVFFYTLRDGKIIENRRLIDMATLDKQLKGQN